MRILLFLFLGLIFGSHTLVPDSPYTDEFLLGQFDPARDPGFSLIEKNYTGKSGIYMKTTAYEAFKKMHAAAKADGITLTIISATRNFDYQKQIWERKWNDAKFSQWKGADRAREILKYSSMPGTSRHHWGTDIDLNSVTPSDFTTGPHKKVYDWLKAHAAEYGFYQTYTDSPGRTGYQEEKWHWSYMAEGQMMLKLYNLKITPEKITGFLGSEFAGELNVIRDYVNGIDPALLDPKN
ncbi:MAG: M15 family metallopeptidase [Flavobacteriales bacterium]|nr:M15 family metallopeptidase [Flavobacteriales bacterium]